MDSQAQDHHKMHSSGHESHGVHLCHKCGWPFPNAHPSAKHRRAHKRVCGTLEGYKVVDPDGHSVSDDDHDHSDDDHRTPSPKTVEKSASGKLSESVNRSEDEVFSDAVTEFPDSRSGPGIEAVPATNDDKIAGKDFKDLNIFYSFKDSGVDDIIEPQSKSLESTQMKIPEDPENMADLSGSILANKRQLASELSPIKPEIPTDQSQGTKIINASDDVTEDVRLFPGEYAGQTSEAESKNQENEEITSGPMPADGVVLLKEDRGGQMLSKMSSSDPTSKFESFEHVNAADAAKVMVGAEQGLDPSGSINSMDLLSGKGEGKENVHKLSVPADIPVVDNAETTLLDFKDHKRSKLQSATWDSCERIERKKDDIEDPLSVENFNSFHSGQPSEVTEVSASDMHLLEDNHLHDSMPEVDNHLDEVTKVSASDMHVLEVKYVHESMPVVESMYSDMKSDGPQILTEVKHTVGAMDANAGGMYDAGNHEKAIKAMCDVAEKDGSEKLREASYAKNSETALESANLPGYLVNQTTNLHGSDGAGESEKAKAETYSLVEVESTGESVEGKVPSKIETAFESASSLHETQVSAQDVRTLCEMKLPEAKSENLDGASAEVLTNDNVKAQRECFAEHGRNVEILERTPEDHATIIPQSSPLDTESSVQSSVAIDDNNHGGELGGVDSVVNQSLQRESDDNNFLKHQLGASANDVSVDSLSQTDSLEANWGSISVLSTQSDTPPVVDTDTMISTDSVASTEAEKTNLKKGGLTERQHSEKSEVFEAPSFMTLVEPGGGGGHKTAASDVLPAQNLQQQKAPPSQAGWFPSLTHVANESPGRKKNEEIIAKVTNWSTTGKQHTPLKNLLGEANLESKPKSPNPRENKTPNNETTVQNNNGAPGTKTVSSITSPEVPTAEHAKKDTVKELNSPARYPADIKREKKVKGRPYWAQFVCCASVN